MSPCHYALPHCAPCAPQDRARAEALGALKSSAGEAVAAASLPLITCIIYETLRLFPAVPIIVRTAGCDVTLTPPTAATAGPGALATEGGPLTIRAGTGVVVDVAMLHRDKVRAAGMPSAPIASHAPSSP